MLTHRQTGDLTRRHRLNSDSDELGEIIYELTAPSRNGKRLAGVSFGWCISNKEPVNCIRKNGESIRDFQRRSRAVYREATGKELDNEWLSHWNNHVVKEKI